MENLYEHLEELRAEKKWKRTADVLEKERDSAFLSRSLVTMKTDIDLSSQVIDIQKDLLWSSGDRSFLERLGLARYADVLLPI